MNKWKIFAILMSMICFGAINETARIFTSDEPDIVANRSTLIPMSVFLTALFILLCIWFWIKSSKPR